MNMFINDIFLFVEKTDICNFADDNTIYCCDKNLTKILENLKHDMQNLLFWFKINSLKANPEKFQLMFLGKKNNSPIRLKINSAFIEESEEVTLLGITIDNKLRFQKHIDNLCHTANLKLKALRRIRKYLTVDKAKLLCNAFINSQFNYAPLIWMFCRKTEYNKIRKIHHKALKIVYESDGEYEELLQKSNNISIHQKHLGFLALEIFKSLNCLNPEFMWSYFNINITPYNLRKGQILNLPLTKSTYFGTNSILFRGCYLWNNLPKALKTCTSVPEFRTKLNNLGNIHCSCLICRD